MLAAAERPDAVRSLAVLEPPAFDVARGDAAVEEFCAPFERGEFPREPRAYLEWFLPRVGSALRLPERLPPELEGGARAAIAERPPYEAEIPFAALREARFPKLIVTGGHSAAFDAVCDVLERELDAEPHAERPAELLVAAGGLAQPVVDVQRADRLGTGEPDRDVEQADRVATAGEQHDDGRALREQTGGADAVEQVHGGESRVTGGGRDGVP
jgi:hypothetical protein